MSRSQFENYYGVDLSTDAGKWQAAQAMAHSPTQSDMQNIASALGAGFMGMGGNTAYFITVLKPAVYDSHGNRLADQVNGVVNLSIGVGRSELVIAQQGDLPVLQAGVGDYLLPLEKHFNGSLGLVATAVDGYNRIPNDAKRKFAYQLSKTVGGKPGNIYQGAKAFTNSTGKLTSKLGPVGTLLTLGVIGYEVGTDSWDAHTIVNGSLLVVTGVATFFAAPAVLVGVAAYGIGDYFFDFSGKIDAAVGRDSGLWKK